MSSEYTFVFHVKTTVLNVWNGSWQVLSLLQVIDALQLQIASIRGVNENLPRMLFIRTKESCDGDTEVLILQVLLLGNDSYDIRFYI